MKTFTKEQLLEGDVTTYIEQAEHVLGSDEANVIVSAMFGLLHDLGIDFDFSVLYSPSERSDEPSSPTPALAGPN